MAPPSQLAIATSSVQRLVKEEASYHKELTQQEARLEKLIASEDGDENAEFQLKQEVSLPLILKFRLLGICYIVPTLYGNTIRRSQSGVSFDTRATPPSPRASVFTKFSKIEADMCYSVQQSKKPRQSFLLSTNESFLQPKSWRINWRHKRVVHQWKRSQKQRR